jgi:hypothetical protein
MMQQEKKVLKGYKPVFNYPEHYFTLYFATKLVIFKMKWDTLHLLLIFHKLNLH